MIGQPDIAVSLLGETSDCLARLRDVSRLLCELEIPHETLCGRDGAQEILTYAESSERRGILLIVASSHLSGEFLRRLVAKTLVPVLELRAGAPQEDEALRLVLTIGSILALEDLHARGALEAFRAAHGLELEPTAAPA